MVDKEVRPKDLDREINTIIDKTILRIASDLVNEMKEEAPVDTGRLRQSIQILRKRDNDIYVGTNLDYADDVQYGAPPHEPPIVPLKKWVRRKLGKDESYAYAVKSKIKEEGTNANPYVTRAIENLRDKYG